MQDTGQNQEESKVQVGQAVRSLQDRAFVDATFTSPGNTNAALDFNLTKHTGHSPPTLQTPLPDNFVHGPYTLPINSYLQEVDQYRAFLCLPSSDVPSRGQTATVHNSQDRVQAKI
ncbi:MAG: hypothetical protein FRX48_04763 [Lasallia pustulata]|uniref:Uncharacterized protein n=1 Tax=Lasallia pustulata TaxID=136370 RepID=A0A5M8PS16_9LECA|nr:MAG: hypothetical protein FRX48_04763 [Lasallia pustulata]